MNEMLKINAKGEKVSSLEDYASNHEDEDTEFKNVVGQDSLTRFDKKRSKKKFKKKA